MNNFFKQVKDTAKQEAIKAAKQMANEPLEMLKNTGIKIPEKSETSKPGMSMMQEIMTGNGSVKDILPEMEQSIHAQTKSRLQQIENELRQLRMQKEQRSQEWMKEQNSLMGIGNQQTEKPKNASEAPGKPKHGPKGPGQNKKGNMEVGKQNKG